MRVSHRQLINSNPPPLKAEGDFFMLNILGCVDTFSLKK